MNRRLEERKRIIAGLLKLGHPRLANLVAAGSGLSNTTKAAIRHHRDLSVALRQLNALVDYRLYGEGSRDPFTGEPSVSPQQKKQAAAFNKKVKTALRSVEEAYNQLRDLDREAKTIDKFMNFS